jgi:hypothetical protein
MKLVSRPGRIALLIFVLVIIPAMSFSQDLPAVPKVISQTSFEAPAGTYTLEVHPGKDARVAKGNLYCANPREMPELNCGNCSLVLKLGQKEVSRISLGSFMFVYDQGEWRVTGKPPLNILKGSRGPLISVSQYGGCNGNVYKFYWIDTRNRLALKPIRFVGFQRALDENEVYAGMGFQDAVRLVETSRFYGQELWVSGYNNADVGSFLQQFGERTPGEWNLIGYYTQVGGSSEMVNKLLAK